MTYESELSFNEGSATLSIPIRLRERHITEDADSVTVQPIGHELQVTIWSDRDNMVIRLPQTEWRAGVPESRTLVGANNGLVNLGKFADTLDYDDEGSIEATITTTEIDEQ